MAASTATSVLFDACMYIVPSTTSGLKMTVPVTGKLQATPNCVTLDLLIWSSAEYWDECAPPPYAAQVV